VKQNGILPHIAPISPISPIDFSRLLLFEADDAVAITSASSAFYFDGEDFCELGADVTCSWGGHPIDSLDSKKRGLDGDL
jgi:hypothetical protein